jgi:hypothetical protein
MTNRIQNAAASPKGERERKRERESSSSSRAHFWEEEGKKMKNDVVSEDEKCLPWVTSKSDTDDWK